MPARLRPVLRSRGGTATLEFGLSSMALVTFVIGIVEVGRFWMTATAVRTATAEAVRMVTVRGAANMNAAASPCTGLSGSLAGAAARTRLLDAGRLQVTLSGCQTQAGVSRVTVTASYPYDALLPAIIGVRTLRETSVAVFN